MSQPFRSIAFPVGVDRSFRRTAEETRYAAHVEQLIKQVLLTNPGERVNRPDFGCGLRRMVFAPGGDVAATLLQATVHQSLDRWLGSVIRVEQVTLFAADERLEVRLVYTVLTGRERRYLNVEVTH